ncbi:LacI family DNA-binding transcriptional regulator [Mycobacterium sp.]|uniref:LacI family DNA-binding transcriptional regulator n=1 Tax=Mycobacterium sp. TaxID=1785 RepID=UPI002C652A4E|nr:LacI family DNA-binding transcriptional regulator [Mycobacterium sp.]HTH84215.1 LacI family DNA-binding transcriptional regulator [Mycobacterium sp.]
MARVTLTDVAKDAGVSRATASMVLNDSPLIAQATKERVRESFARLGYVYDRAAASLRKNQSLAVGLVITQLSNPYFAEFVEGIQSELDDRGMDVLLGISAEDRARQRRVLVSMSERRVDGVVVIPAHQSEPADFAGLHMPIVMLARRVKGFDTDYVGGDNYAGSVAATNHLLVTHGARRPAFIGGHVYASAREERLGGFLSAAGVLGIKVPVRNQPACVPDRVVARNVAAELIARDPKVDAIVCFNDAVAFGVVDAVADAGLQVGRDIRVIGFDDVKDAERARPALASVSVPAETAGRRAAQLLLKRISGSEAGPQGLILPAELMPRESCGCGLRVRAAS